MNMIQTPKSPSCFFSTSTGIFSASDPEANATLRGFLRGALGLVVGCWYSFGGGGDGVRLYGGGGGDGVRDGGGDCGNDCGGSGLGGA